MTSTPPTDHPDDADDPARPDHPERLDREGAEELGDRLQQQAALIAEATCEFLLMLGEFDARGGVGWYVGLKSTAHWVSWACSMSPGTAREHVRIARALPSMPRTVAAFKDGRLSYSKVREMTRVADRVDEDVLVDLACAMTAAQLARTLSSVRAVDGARLGQDAIRQARWNTREDGMVEIRATLPPEMGAELITALDLALDRDGHDIPSSPDPDAPATDPGPAAVAAESPTGWDEETGTVDRTASAAAATTTATLEQRRADALLEIARGYLDHAPSDRSGEDRHLVVVQVNADSLTQHTPDSVPAGTPEHATGNVPAGTSQQCHVVGQNTPLEMTTAERLTCTGRIALQVTDKNGEILHLGRTRRLASPAQRRALRLRDRTCSFPGCHQSRHLDAHHTTPWSEGGTTDIEHLALLCRRHHVMVHEGGYHLVPRALGNGPAAPHLPRHTVIDQQGQPVTARWPAMLEHITHTPDALTPHGDPERITGTTRGYGFHLAECVDALLATLTTAA